MVMDEVNEFLMSGGVPSAKFEQLGATVSGTVEHVEVRDQTDFKTGKVLTWDDGKPRKQLVITLQTGDKDDADDDGMRRVYAKGQMLSAVREAVRKTGERGIGIGGQLAVQYEGDGTPPAPNLNAPKLYKAWYEAPTQQVAIPDDAPPWARDDVPMPTEVDRP